MSHILESDSKLSAIELNRIVSPREAARLLGLSVDTLRREERRGVLTRIQVSRRCIGYRLRDVLKLGDAEARS